MGALSVTLADLKISQADEFELLGQSVSAVILTWSAYKLIYHNTTLNTYHKVNYLFFGVFEDLNKVCKGYKPLILPDPPQLVVASHVGYFCKHKGVQWMKNQKT